MRILLATAVAIAPLMVAAGAQAEQVISNGRTTPISTSTANNGARDDVRIANDGRRTVHFVGRTGGVIPVPAIIAGEVRAILAERRAGGPVRAHVRHGIEGEGR